MNDLTNTQNEIQHCRARLIYSPTYEKIMREITELGISPKDVPHLANSFYYRAVKVERVEIDTATRIREIVKRLGGKAIMSAAPCANHGIANILIVANASCLCDVVSELSNAAPPLQEVARELEQLIRVGTSAPGNQVQLAAKGRVLDFCIKTYIMGILNVTPDSFSDGGAFFDQRKAIEQAHRMVEEGADIIDVGGESTRPGAEPIPPEEELRRVLPVIKAIAGSVDAMVSIDTTKARVAEEALGAGAEMINDVSALRFDPTLALLAARSGVPIVLMHMRGNPQTMQQDIHYNDTLSEIVEHLRERIAFAQSAGIKAEQIIVDPGIGFGKSLERDNFTILRNLQELSSLGRPILVGPSRKAFLGKLLGLAMEDRLEATAAAVAVAVMNGASIVRVHDVKPMKRVVAVVDAIKKAVPVRRLAAETLRIS